MKVGGFGLYLAVMLAFGIGLAAGASDAKRHCEPVVDKVIS